MWVLLVVQPVNLQFLHPEVEQEQGFGRTCQSSFSLCSAWAGWSLADKMCPASTDCIRQGRTHPWALQWEKPDFQTVGQLWCENLGSPAWASASSMDWVVNSVTRPAWRSFRRFHTWCLEQGSNPAVGSSRSNTCKGERGQISSCPSQYFHAYIISFHAFRNLTLRITCILK